MKPILIAGATLLAAGGAFAFAAAVDHLTPTPDIAGPELGHMTERNLHSAPQPRKSPSIASIPSMPELPQPEGPDEQVATTDNVKEIAVIDHDEATASPRVNYFVPFTDPGETLETSTDHSSAGSSEATTRRQFENLHQIGVYR